MKKEDKILVLGIGNIGRQDDGLGWLFLDYLQKAKFGNMDLEYRYQLQIEDAELLSNYKTVIFVDATKENTNNGFYYRTCVPSDNHSFSTHELCPETVLFLAINLYQHRPKAFILGIQGYVWNLEIGLSQKAKINLYKAEEFLFKKIAKFDNIESI
jgi:hydrogenase maturation protease